MILRKVGDYNIHEMQATCQTFIRRISVEGTFLFQHFVGYGEQTPKEVGNADVRACHRGCCYRHLLLGLSVETPVYYARDEF